MCGDSSRGCKNLMQKIIIENSLDYNVLTYCITGAHIEEKQVKHKHVWIC